MWSRNYYQYVEKETDRVSYVWKVLHVSIFFLTAITSLLSAYGSENISEKFHQRCVLYATPNLKLQEVANKESDIQNATTTANLSLGDISNAETMDSTINTHNESIYTNITSPEKSQQTLILDLSKAEQIPGTNDTFLSERQIWFDNASLSGKLGMEYIGTTFGKTSTCNFVLFVPLSSLVIAAVLGVIAVLCGKGGRGYETDVLPRSWSIVYPVIILSVLMTLLSVMAAITVTDGLDAFCAHFEPYTGQNRCTYSINYFLLGKEMTFDGFWQSYAICKYCYIFGALLWTAQLSITVLRLLRVVDFQFNMIDIGDRRGENDDEDKLYKVHEAVVKSYPGLKLVVELADEDPDEITADANGEAGTQL